MTSDFKDIFKETRRLVNEWDPCSFIEAGAPTDEYDALTSKILSGVINHKQGSELRDEIIDLLDNYYGYPVFEELSTEKQELLISEIELLIEKVKKN